MPTRYPGGIFPAWHGLYFDPESWDGSDFFMSADGYGAIFAVEEVTRVFRKAKIKNISFKRLTDITRSRMLVDMAIRAQQEEEKKQDT